MDGGIEFTNAKESIKTYFTNQSNGSLPNLAILDLFNENINEDQTDIKIREFLKKNEDIKTLFVYYVGHGQYSKNENCLVLTIKTTREENLTVSSIRLSSFGSTLKALSSNRNLILIFDCCYSGAAITSLMSPIDNTLQNEFEQNYPQKGISLIASSSKDFPSFKLEEKSTTLFTEGLVTALNQGDVTISKPVLSLREIKTITDSKIRQLRPDNSVYPIIISPRQNEGDIADIPLFLNYAFRDRSADINIQADRIINAMTNVDFNSVATMYLDYVKNFDKRDDYLIEAVLLATSCKDLYEEKEKNPTTYKETRKIVYTEILTSIREIKRQAV
ncbi:Caspase domain-containing protein [Dyadobacter sp. SG02]|nr:Caspase domain-containing protein [Dyadobacter sp. SG02]